LRGAKYPGSPRWCQCAADTLWSDGVVE
jgi:hypothetical protein